jgi:hypothetical protein
MALISRFMSPDWAANDELAAADLSAEFNTIHNALKDGTVDINIGSETVHGTANLQANCTIGANVNSVHTLNGTLNVVSNFIANVATINVLTVNSIASLTATNIAVSNINASTAIVVNNVDVATALVPLGSIIPHYDFDNVFPINTTYWAYCDGSAATIDGNSYTLPDLSGRYLVGFGGATDGAGDIDTATWNVDVIGSALHQVDLSHTHTGPSHTHTFAHTHEHTHTHSAGTLAACIAINDSTGTVSDGISVKRTSTTAWDASVTDDAGGSVTAGDSYNNGAEVQGSTGGVDDDATTDSQSTSTTSSSGTGNTGSGGSATQSIQPRSVRVRFIMRIK